MVFSSICTIINGFYLCNDKFLDEEAVARPLTQEGFFRNGSIPEAFGSSTYILVINRPS